MSIYPFISRSVEVIWYQKKFFSYLLYPFSWIYRLVLVICRCQYRLKFKKKSQFPVPIVVVGNITVGGSGKTPLAVALAKWFKQCGWQPGIVSRGYSGISTSSPRVVLPTTDPILVGEEAVLLASKTGCAVVVAKDRVAAVEYLLTQFNCNLVISDDGLQHWPLSRDVDIAVVDGQRRFGNGYCLPAGPLREPIERLTEVDFIVNNGGESAGEWSMSLIPGQIYQLNRPERSITADELKDRSVHAVAGIGNPQRFFDSLKKLGFKIIPHAFPDHYFFKKADLEFADDAVIIMTEKDAVKCRDFANDRMWCLPVHAELPELFLRKLHQKINISQKNKSLESAKS